MTSNFSLGILLYFRKVIAYCESASINGRVVCRAGTIIKDTVQNEQKKVGFVRGSILELVLYPK